MTKFNDVLNAKEIGEFEGRTVHKLNTALIWTNGSKVVEIPAGFECDLASVPRVPIVFYLWGDRAHREAVLHDYLYRKNCIIYLNDHPVTLVEKEEADWLFREAMIGQGVRYCIYHPMYIAVRSFGGDSFHRFKVEDNFPLDVRY